jgi:hypothetical protein
LRIRERLLEGRNAGSGCPRDDRHTSIEAAADEVVTTDEATPEVCDPAAGEPIGSGDTTMTRISSAGMWLAALALLTLAPGLGYAADRDVTVRWNPSPSEGVDRYVLYVGINNEGGPYTHKTVDLGDPDPDPEQYGGKDCKSQTVQLDDSAARYLVLRAVGADGQESVNSNPVTVEGAEIPPVPEPLGTPGQPVLVPSSGSEDPEEYSFGVTSLEGIDAVASGEIFVEALVDSGTESVEFRLDGAFFRIENAAPYGFNTDEGPGALNPWDTGSVADGFHTISATGYSQDGAGGETGRTVEVRFEVSNN